ncbi:MAG: shikimate dehydrogenase [Pyrinomonadaceae bacterium]
MNRGKICVSVCAETVDKIVEKTKSATNFADVIELRFDCLKNLEAENLRRKIDDLRKNFSGKLLATFRSAEQGGKSELSFENRENFWTNSRIFENVDWADLELDFPVENINKLWRKSFSQIIKSFHNFDNAPKNLENIYKELLETSSDVIKIAVQAEDVTDAIPVWKLLGKAKSDNKKFIPIAMGEAGKWTRILGLAHGAFMTYAALEDGDETAPGQISARDLIETYRVRELNEQTEIYSVLGGNTSYSLSPFMQNAAFKQQNLNAVFIPFQVKNLDGFIKRMTRAETREIDLNFKGFSVTIPHKQAIIKYLDYVDEASEKIGAVNTVKIADGKFYGYNTDALGFIEPLRNFYGDLRNARVAILGAGGAARACIYALKKENAEVMIFARDLKKAKSLADDFKVRVSKFKVQSENYNDFDILVNTTPLDTKGEMKNETIVFAEQIESVKLVYDLVYNPSQTRLMSEADKANVPKIGGTAMLVAQGAEQFRIWTGKTAPVKEMRAAVLKRLELDGLIIRPLG